MVVGLVKSAGSSTGSPSISSIIAVNCAPKVPMSFWHFCSQSLGWSSVPAGSECICVIMVSFCCSMYFKRLPKVLEESGAVVRVDDADDDVGVCQES